MLRAAALCENSEYLSQWTNSICSIMLLHGYVNESLKTTDWLIATTTSDARSGSCCMVNRRAMQIGRMLIIYLYVARWTTNVLSLLLSFFVCFTYRSQFVSQKRTFGISDAGFHSPCCHRGSSIKVNEGCLVPKGHMRPDSLEFGTI